MRPFLFFGLLLFAGCGDKRDRAVMGQITRAELTEMKGEPIKEEEIPEKDGKILTFEGEEKFQVRGEKVVARFRVPEGDQKLLLYWKHRLKSCETLIKAVESGTETTHETPERELSCPKEGISVVYPEGSGFVTRIYEFEKN